jgi:hypothetical protein
VPYAAPSLDWLSWLRPLDRDEYSNCKQWL